MEYISSAVCSLSGKVLMLPILPDWLAIAIFALAVSATLLSIMYVFSIIFSNPGLNAFAKFEMWELGATVVIILVVTMITGTMCSVKVGDVFVNSTFKDYNAYEASFRYFEFLDSKIIGWMTANHALAMGMDQLASSTIYSKPLGLGLVTSPGAGLGGPLKNILNQMTSAMAVAFIINHAQKAVMEFGIYGLLNFYLPIGIVLRAFTPTRRLGGALIALAIGFLVIYPAITVITSEVVYAPVKQVDDAIWGSVKNNALPGLKNVFSTEAEYGTMLGNSVHGGTMIDANGNYVPLDQNPQDPSMTVSIGKEKAITSIVGDMFGTIWGGAGEAAKKAIFAIVLIPSAAIGMAFAAGFIMPAINILIFVQAIKSLSKTLGDEIDITTLTRMI